jgi:hypothetical protein
MTNSLTGEITTIYIENGSTLAEIRTGQTTMHVPLFLLLEARVGDTVRVEAGMAVSRLNVAVHG